MASHADRMISLAEDRLAQALADGDSRKALEARTEITRWQGIRGRVDLAPPLTASQRDQLAVLLRPVAEPQPSPRRGRRVERPAA